MNGYEKLMYDTYGKYRDILKDIYGDLLLYEPRENDHISGAYSEVSFISNEKELIDRSIEKGFLNLVASSDKCNLIFTNNEGIGINFIRIDHNLDRIVCFPLDEL